MTIERIIEVDEKTICIIFKEGFTRHYYKEMFYMTFQKEKAYWKSILSDMDYKRMENTVEDFKFLK